MYVFGDYNTFLLMILLSAYDLSMAIFITVSDYSFEYISIILSLIVFVVATTIIQKTTFGFKVSPLEYSIFTCIIVLCQ